MGGRENTRVIEREDEFDWSCLGTADGPFVSDLVNC